MFDNVHQKFPRKAAEIELLVGEDPDFAMLIADFEELSGWLVSNAKTNSSSEIECENVTELISELEQEIRQKLETHSDVTIQSVQRKGNY